ncbi:MAG: hypothetical protein Q9219_003268 [cf. Caloplaca sp. 3 TL-2023]
MPFKSNSTQNSFIEPRLLLMKRSSSHPFRPDGWEFPSGVCEMGDRTFFHSLARAVRTETNLNISFIVRQVGKCELFSPDDCDENILKVFFEARCAEIEELSMSSAPLTDANFQDYLGSIPVRTSEPHQCWAWLDTDTVKTMWQGQAGERFSSPAEGITAIKAFGPRESQGAHRSFPYVAGNWLRRKDAEKGANGHGAFGS